MFDLLCFTAGLVNRRMDGQTDPWEWLHSFNTVIAQTGLVEIDLTDEAIIEERVLVDTGRGKDNDINNMIIIIIITIVQIKNQNAIYMNNNIIEYKFQMKQLMLKLQQLQLPLMRRQHQLQQRTKLPQLLLLLKKNRQVMQS